MGINLAVIAGDGIGPEVTGEALKVLAATANIDATEFDLGARRYHATGEILPDDDLAKLAQYDAILLGAIGDPSVPSGLLERGLLLKLRFALDHYVNLRPGRTYPGVPTPLKGDPQVDLLVCREGTEGLYVGNGGSVRTGTDAEIATEVSVNTAYGVRRLARYAAEQAARRRGKLTLVHKHNVLVHAGDMWRRICEEEAAEAGVSLDYLHVDAATILLVTDPGRFDVIVTDNLFGDILTDEVGAVTGGIGLAASGNLNPSGAYPSMFEPVHGSAPDIAGTNTADPIAAIGSAALLLDHLRLDDEAAQVRRAIDAHMEARANKTFTEMTTTAIGSDVADRIGKD